MANRFPLIVNQTSKKIEELVSGDNLDLTGNNIIANSSTGTSGQYLKTNGATVVWDNPGDVYLTASQTLTNKTIESSIISGQTNTFTFIPNAALVNNSITVNGTAIDLGGTVTTPDNNTTYSISAQDGGNAATKVIRLTSGGNSGAGVDDDINLVAGTNVTLSRTGDAITINSSYVDTNTVTRLAASGGVLTSGDVTISGAGSIVASQIGSTITLTGTDTNTVTRLRGTATGTYTSGDLQLLAGNSNLSVVQSGTDITLSSVDTITRVRGTGGTLSSGDITIAADGSSTVAQVGNTITISSSYVDTITRVRGTSGGTYTSGDLTIAGGGATSVVQTGSTITISSVDTNTTYTAGTAITLSGTTFSLKNNANLTGSALLKWDSGNSQITNSIISDDGSAVTIAGDLTVTGATTTVSSQTVVIEDAQIELRKGLNLTGVDAGVQVNRTTNNLGVVSSYSVMQWYESGGYWRTYDGSVGNRLVTEGETQTLSNKTLSNPTLTTPTIGAATATTINGLAISAVVNGTLTIANNKTFTCNNTLTFSGTDASTVGFGAGGTVVYTTNNLSTFASTTSAQLRGVLSDETGVGVAVFGTSPTFTTSVLTGSTTFAVFNTTATTINAFGAATAVNIGATTGTTTVRNALQVNGNTTLGNAVGDTITITGTLDFTNADFTIRGGGANPIAIGRGGNEIATNTRMGYNCLNSNTSGSQNVAIGYEAAKTINSGASIVAIGYQALTNAGTGQHNIAIGRSALTGILTGQRNVGLGSNTLESNTIGTDNVAIGYYAGAGATGNGNVLIGPAPDGNNTNVTHTPPSPSGDRQLVIGSGTSTWIRGDNNFDVTLPQNANVGGDLIVSGNLTINGTTTTINTNVLSVDDKLIDLADVSARTFTASIVSNSANITAISPVTGLIPGTEVSISTAGLSVPGGTTIVSITNNTAVLSNPVTGSSGTATFVSTGATDTTADGGGIRIKGTTDKSITYSNATTAFTSTEHFDLATGKAYRIGNVQIANGSTTTLGPTTGAWGLGAGVTSSSLTSVGTLSSLSVTGNTVLTGKLTTNTPTTLSTTLDVGISFTNTSAKTYPTTSSFGVIAGLSQNIELGTAQTIDTVTPGGFNFVRGIENTLTKSAGNTQDIERLYFNGFAQNFNWADANTCKQYVGISDTFNYSGINANGRTSSSFNAQSIYLSPPNGGTQTISNVTATNSLDIVTFAATATVNITNGYGVVPSFSSRALASGTNTTTIGSYTFLGTSPFWGSSAFGSAINNTTITNLYGLRLTPPSSSNGLTITNNWGIYQEWGNANNYFAGNIQMASGKGIDFSATANAAGMTSELLDDYEEGTWTPSVGGNATYTTQAGSYVKIGRLVYLNFDLRIGTLGTGSAQYIIPASLPFVYLGVGGNARAAGSINWFTNLAISRTAFYLEMDQNGIYVGSSNGSSNTIDETGAFGNSSGIMGSFCYETSV